VVLITDGGGKVNAARRPITTADKVGRFLLGIRDRGVGDAQYDLATVNGRPGVRAYLDGVLDTVVTWDAVDGRVTAIYLVRNPDKVGTADRTRSVTR
jgi:RNA polymerase sigma-70 factor (ECF subfamily)